MVRCQCESPPRIKRPSDLEVQQGPYFQIMDQRGQVLQQNYNRNVTSNETKSVAVLYNINLNILFTPKQDRYDMIWLS